MTNEQRDAFVADLAAVLRKHKASLNGYSNYHTTLFPVEASLGDSEPIHLGFICNGTSTEIRTLLKEPQ